MNDCLSIPAAAPLPPGPASDYPFLNPMDGDGAPQSSLEIQRFLAFLRKYWWVPCLTLALSLGGVITYLLKFAPPAFVSKASMWESVKIRLPGEGSLFGAEDLQTYLGTQMEALKSPKIRSLALASLMAAGSNAVPRDNDGAPLDVDIKIIGVPKSALFLLEASSPDPDYTPRFLSALMNQYLDYKKSVRKGVSGGTLASITEQVEAQERALHAAETNLAAFQRTNNLGILEEQGKIAGAYLSRLKTQLSDLQLEHQLLEATALAQIAVEPGQTNVGVDLFEAMRRVSAPSTSEAVPERLTALQEVEVLKAQREKLSRNLRPKHPKIVRLDADIEKGQKLIQIFRGQNSNQLMASQQAVKMKITNVVTSIKEWETNVVQANALIAEAERLKLNVTRVQTLYERLAMIQQSVGFGGNIEQESLAILEPATEAKRSYKRDLMLLALAVMGGLGSGLGLVFVVCLRDDRLISLAEVNRKFADGTVGQVPELRKPRRRTALPLLEANDARHMYAESYRSLRSALLFLPLDGVRPKIILITSALPNEGKSTIAANLARTVALGGGRVLLVDADMRKGRLHEMMGIRNEPGLSDLLRNPIALEEVIQSDSTPNLAFIARGTAVGNPGDLLLGPAFEQLLARWRQQFDCVLIDSCPVFAADDTTTLAPKVDGTLLVVRSRFSRARVVREALDQLYQRQAKVLGLVFNRAEAASHAYYYYKDAAYAPRQQTSQVSRP